MFAVTESIKRKKNYSKQRIKKHVLYSLILSIVILVFFGSFILEKLFNFTYSPINFIELTIELACSIYSLFIIIKYKIIRSKIVAALAAICGVAFAIYESLRMPAIYGKNSFILFANWLPPVVKSAVVLTYVLRGFLLFVIILELWYLVRSKRSKRRNISAVSENRIHSDYSTDNLENDDMPVTVEEQIEDIILTIDSEQNITKKTNKKFIAPCVAIIMLFAIAFSAVSYVRNSFTVEEKEALRIVEKYQNMLKDPDSLVLRSDVVIIRTWTDAKFTTFCFFTASGNNSFGASVTNTVCFVDGKYICNTNELEKKSDISNPDAEQYLVIKLRLLQWGLYGESLADSNEEVIASYSVDAKKIARKLGVTANIR